MKFLLMRPSTSPIMRAAAVAVVVTLLLCGLVTASGGTATRSRHELPSSLSTFGNRIHDWAAAVFSPHVEKVRAYVPAPAQKLAPIFLHGAVSVVMIGRHARRPPVEVNGRGGNELLQHSTEKFVYAAGAILAEMAVLQMVYREPYRNVRRNKKNGWFASAIGFPALILLMALPNDVVDVSLLSVFFFQLSSGVYAPAVVCGQLLRVYLAALVPGLPPLSIAYGELMKYGMGGSAKGLPATRMREALAEAVLIILCVGSVAFCVAATRSAGSPRRPVQESDSEGDDFLDE